MYVTQFNDNMLNIKSEVSASIVSLQGHSKHITVHCKEKAMMSYNFKHIDNYIEYKINKLIN